MKLILALLIATPIFAADPPKVVTAEQQVTILKAQVAQRDAQIASLQQQLRLLNGALAALQEPTFKAAQEADAEVQRALAKAKADSGCADIVNLTCVPKPAK